MFQGSPAEAALTLVGLRAGDHRRGLRMPTATIAGMLPALVKGGFRGPIITTAGTRELAELALLDSGKLHVEQAQAHNDRLQREARREARDVAAASDPPPPPR